MVKLGVKNPPWNDVFYFHNMKDCKIFMNVFADHCCNIPWETPVVGERSDFFDEMDAKDMDYMDKNPKKRAEDNLHWGFSLVDFFGIEDTQEQKDFVDRLVNTL